MRTEGTYYNSTYSRLSVDCALVTRPWWDDPDGSVDDVPGELKDVVELEARSVSLLDDASAMRVESIQDLKSLSHSWISIDPHELVIFEVGVVFHAHVEGYGSASVDFDDGYFAISSPYLAIGVWTP